MPISPLHRRLGDLGALAACTAVVLGLAYVSITNRPEPDLLSRWWVASALATALILRAPRRLLARSLVLLAVALGSAGWLAGLEPALVAGVVVGNVLEVAVVVALITRLRSQETRLASWGDLRRWISGITLGPLLCAAVLGASLSATGDADLVVATVGTALTHLAAQVLLLPLFLHQPDQRVRNSRFEVLSHLALLAVAATLFLAADRDQSVAYVLLPLLVWAAARFPPRWAMLELYAVSVGVALASITGIGPLGSLRPDLGLLEIAATAQAFVVVSGITAVSFMVALNYLRQALQRNREHEVQLGQLLDSASGTAFIATDLDGVITWFSPGAEQLTGHRAQDLVGRCDPLLFHCVREVADRAEQLGVAADYRVLTHAVRRGAPQETRDWTYLHRDGRRLTVSVSTTPVRDDGGTTQGHLSVVRDVTDLRAASQALVQALDKERETTRRLERLDRAKSDFVSSVSHDLRTPLTSIMGYTEILQADLATDLTEQQREVIEKIDRNSGRLLHLVEDLLTLARFEEGTAPVEKGDIDLRAAVRGAVDAVSHAAYRSEVTLRTRIPERGVLLQGDAHQLERMVVNLVGNAVKFTPAGGRVDVGLDVVDAHARIRVEDTGIGIPLEEQDQLFQRFFRSSSATERAIHGSGLGLSIVRSIADAHGGRIELTSQPGVGTTFVVHVPLATEAEPAQPSRARSLRM